MVFAQCPDVWSMRQHPVGLTGALDSEDLRTLRVSLDGILTFGSFASSFRVFGFRHGVEMT